MTAHSADIAQFSDAFLATCVDEYVKRVVNRARSMEYNEEISINISASQFRRDADYDIEHQVSLGYSKPNIRSNNCLNAVTRLISRWREDQGYAPITVTVMLPPPSESIEDGEFENVTL